MGRKQGICWPGRKQRAVIASASLWLVVFSLSLLGPLLCIIHCVEGQRVAHSGASRALFTCQLFGDNTPRGQQSADSGQHSSAPILPESFFSLLRAYAIVLLAHQAALTAPLLLVAFVGIRRLRHAPRAADAPPTPPPRLACHPRPAGTPWG
ncbi:MAG: hypothetical protein H7Y32_06215 [Chloroflexales bacterium]|nr:hypothetical protein [Chloroflexales bacterium]